MLIGFQVWHFETALLLQFYLGRCKEVCSYTLSSQLPEVYKIELYSLSVFEDEGASIKCIAGSPKIQTDLFPSMWQFKYSSKPTSVMVVGRGDQLLSFEQLHNQKMSKSSSSFGFNINLTGHKLECNWYLTRHMVSRCLSKINALQIDNQMNRLIGMHIAAASGNVIFLKSPMWTGLACSENFYSSRRCTKCLF